MSYTEEQLQRDVQVHSDFFQEMLHKHMIATKEKIDIDWRTPKHGWEYVYEEVVRLGKARNRNPVRLCAAVINAQVAFAELRNAADEEISEQYSDMMKSLQIMKSGGVSQGGSI